MLAETYTCTNGEVPSPQSCMCVHISASEAHYYTACSCLSPEGNMWSALQCHMCAQPCEGSSPECCSCCCLCSHVRADMIK